MKKFKTFNIWLICLLIPFFILSCGGGNDEAKPAKTKTSGSALDKMTSMAASSTKELKGIEDKAKSEMDLNKLTKIAEDMAKKEKELNSEFVEFVAKNAANLTIPVEQNLHQEYYELKPIRIEYAESIEKIKVAVEINPLKTPYPNKENWVYLKLVDKDGNVVKKLPAPKKYTKELTNGGYIWNPFLSPAMFDGVVKAVVITNEEFKSK